jgi:hypothetical protein
MHSGLVSATSTAIVVVPTGINASTAVLGDGSKKSHICHQHYQTPPLLFTPLRNLGGNSRRGFFPAVPKIFEQKGGMVHFNFILKKDESINDKCNVFNEGIKADGCVQPADEPPAKFPQTTLPRAWRGHKGAWQTGNGCRIIH